MARGANGIKRYGNRATQYFVGPLNLDRQSKRATTVTGAELMLDTDEFDALDMLAAHAGEAVTYERIYEAVWSAGDHSCSRSAARLRLWNLMSWIGKIGEGLMWIEYTPESGYCFRTNKGYNWQKADI